jgi:hypothetical protein
LQLALYRLLDEDVFLLKGKRLDKDYFNTLLTGGDPIRDLLQWLDQGDALTRSVILPPSLGRVTITALVASNRQAINRATHQSN